MSAENIKIVSDYFMAVADRDLAKLPDLLSETLVWHQPGSSDLSQTYHSRDSVFGLVAQFMERSQGSFKFDSIGKFLTNGNLVAVSLQFSARTETKSMSMAGIDVLRIENGKIQEVWLFSEDQPTEDAFWAK
tara:strand:- start:1297 stop:1692 length:396 start_codon:yes stop_codon:yes gene_type:complete